MAAEWVDIRQHPSTSAYCYLLPLRMVRGNGGDWHFGGGLAADRDIGLLSPGYWPQDALYWTISVPPDS